MAEWFKALALKARVVKAASGSNPLSSSKKEPSMKISLDSAEEISKRVNKKLKEWDIPISVRPGFVVMVALVVREVRAESKKQSAERATEE